MNGFIEVTDKENDKLLVSVNSIFRVIKIKDKTANCRIEQIPKGYGTFPYQAVDVLESYDEVKALINSAV